MSFWWLLFLLANQNSNAECSLFRKQQQCAQICSDKLGNMHLAVHAFWVASWSGSHQRVSKRCRNVVWWKRIKKNFVKRLVQYAVLHSYGVWSEFIFGLCFVMCKTHASMLKGSCPFIRTLGYIKLINSLPLNIYCFVTY